MKPRRPPEFIEILRKNYRLARQRGRLERFKDAARESDYENYTQIQEDYVLPYLRSTRGQLLIAWSGCDETVPIARGMKLLERVPQADMYIFADAGHMVMMDRPRDFNSTVGAWLSS